MYLLKLALRPWRLQWGSELASTFILGLLAFFAVGFAAFDWGFGPVIERLGRRQVVTAYLNPSLAEAESQLVIEKIRVASQAAPETPQEIQVVSNTPEEFLQKLRAAQPELAQQLEAFGDESKSVIPRTVTLAGVISEGLKSEVAQMVGIESIESSAARTEEAVGVLKSVRWVFRGLCIGVLFAAFGVLIQLSKAHLHLSQDANRLFGLLGATPFQVRAPALVAAFMTTAVSALIASVFMITVGKRMVMKLQYFASPISNLPFPQQELIAGCVGLAFIFGVGLAVMQAFGNTAGRVD